MEKLLTTTDTNRDVILVPKYDNEGSYDIYMDGEHQGKLSHGAHKEFKKLAKNGEHIPEKMVLGNAEGFYCLIDMDWDE